MKAFVLAGGFATRLWPLTEKRAKPLLPLAGKPLLTHLVEKIPEGIPITVSTNAVFAVDFENWKSQVSSLKSQVSILIEDAGHEGEKLGALGAVAKWVREEKIHEDVLLLAGDNYIGFSIEEFLKEYRSHPLLAAYDIRDKEKARQLGTVVAEGKNVRAFEEKPQSPRSTLVSTGCLVLPANSLVELTAFAKEKPDNIGGVFEHFLKIGTPIECIAFTEPWFDIGSFEAYLEATKALVGDKVLDGGFQYTSILKQSSGGTSVAQENGNQFVGSVVLGKGSSVRKSTLKNVVLFENCAIEDCILENCILDNGCVLQGVDLTGKMLRENTTLIRNTS